MADEKPKRPLSQYFIWLGNHREKITNDHPELKGTAILKKAGELWKLVEDKSKWEKKAAAAKKKYEEDVAEFVRNGGDMKASKPKKKRNKATSADKVSAKKSKKVVEQDEGSSGVESD